MDAALPPSPRQQWRKPKVPCRPVEDCASKRHGLQSRPHRHSHGGEGICKYIHTFALARVLLDGAYGAAGGLVSGLLLLKSATLYRCDLAHLAAVRSMGEPEDPDESIRIKVPPVRPGLSVVPVRHIERCRAGKMAADDPPGARLPVHCATPVSKWKPAPPSMCVILLMKICIH